MEDDKFINKVIIGIIIALASILGILLYIIYSDVRSIGDMKSKSAQIKTIKIWTIHGGIEATLNEVARAYEREHPDIKIEVTTFKNEIYQSTIENAAITNELPDIYFFWGNEKLKKYVDLDLVWNISDAMKAYYEGERPLEGAMDSVTYNNQIYGMPINGWCTALFCNKELFEQANLEYPTTYEELLSVITKFNEKRIIPISSGSKEMWLLSLYYMNLVLAEGDIEGVYDASVDPSLIRTKQFYNAAKKLEELIAVKPWGDTYIDSDSYDAAYHFSQGETAMILSGSWVASNVEEEISKVKGKIDVIPFPGTPDTVGVGGYSDVLVVSKESPITQDEELQKVYFDIVKEVSTKSVEVYGIGLPAYENQKINNLQFPTLYQCAEIAKGRKMHPAYEQIFNENFASQYFDLLSRLIGGEINSDEFIEQLSQ